MNILSVIVFIILIIVKINGRKIMSEDRGVKSFKEKTIQKKPIQINPVQVKPNVPVSSDTIQKRPVEVRNSKNETTMTDYLADKARKEEMNKESEARKSQAKVDLSQKGLIMGERLLYGDPVPGGKTMMICGYCGAENIVPYMVKGKYHCYFCREIL